MGGCKRGRDSGNQEESGSNGWNDGGREGELVLRRARMGEGAVSAGRVEMQTEEKADRACDRNRNATVCVSLVRTSLNKSSRFTTVHPAKGKSNTARHVC